VLNVHWGAMHAVTFTSKLEVNNIVPMIITGDTAAIQVFGTNRVRIIVNRRID